MKHFTASKKVFSTENDTILADAVQFIESSLKEAGCDRKLILKTVLTAEETMAVLIENAEPGRHLKVKVRRLFGEDEVVISMAGREINALDAKRYSGKELGEMEDEDAERLIRSILLLAQGERLKTSYIGGVNRVRIQVGRAERSLLQMTVLGLVLGLILGALMKSVIPSAFSDGISALVLILPVT